jgi:hypothetical protein
MIISGNKFRNKKTGNIYRLISYAVDCTNERDGTPVVVYCPDSEKETIYIREKEEFFKKFEAVEEPLS